MAHECFAVKLRAENQPGPLEIQPELSIGLGATDDLIDGHPQPTKDLLDVPLRKENLSQMVKISSRRDKVTKC